MKEKLNENYEKLYLGKKDMLVVIDNAIRNMKTSNLSSKRLTLGCLAVKGLVKMTDESTLNVIWNEIIKFTDELRHTNALSDPEIPKLRTLKQINDEKQRIQDKLDRIP